jgi:hypothetical protein
MDELSEAKALLEDARDHLMGFIGSSYSESGKEDMDMVDKINIFLGDPPINWTHF